MTNTTHNKTKTSHKSSFSGLKLSLFFLIFLLVITALPIGYDYSSSTRIADIDPVDDLNARGGKITIRYNQPVSQVNYLAGDESLRIESELSEDGLLEIHTLTAPTRFKQNYTLKKRMDIKRTVFLGLFPLPRRLNITTAAELVSMVHLVPHEDTRPLPAQLNNRIGIQFKGEAIGRYHKNVNIPPEEMDCVKITPDIKGYYQWESDSLLVFNFSEDPPAFETRYEFEVFSDKLLNPEYQEWRGEKSKAITTAGNEVYVTDFSLNGEVDWQTALRIEFSGTMASARDVLKNKSAELIPIEITPKVNGTWVWQDARTLEFQPDTASGWPAGKMVHVQIHPEINREPDRKWRAPQKEYSFTALAPEQSIRNYTLRGDKVALDDGLTVHFSRNMADTSALYKRFPNDNAESPAPFLFSPHVPGDFFWSAPDKLKFRPKDLWPELTRISVNLNPAFNPDPRYTWTGTNTFHFNTLENLIIPEFYFTPEQRIPAETFFADKASYRRNQEIPPESRLWILFDKEPERFPEGKPNSAGAVIIEPAIQGGFTWLSDSLLEFVPDDNWREHTSYTIRLSNKLLSDPRQHFPKDKAEFMFTAGKNQVFVSSMDESTLKPETALKQRPEQALTLDFSKNMNILLHAGESYPIAEVPVEKLPVFIEPPLDAVIYWQNRRQLILQPESYWQPETLYTVTLNFALLPQAEAKFTRGDRFFVRTDKNYVTVTKFSPQGETTLNTVIDVEFDRNIKPAEIKPGEEENIGLFTIQPPLAGTWVWLANNKLQFKPDEALPASSGYTAGFYPEKIEDKQFAWADTGKQVYQFYTVPLHVKQAKTRFEAAKDNFLKQRFLLDIELSAAVSKQMLRKHFSIWHKSYDDKGKLLRIPLSYTLQTGETDAAESVSAFSVESDWLDRPSQTRQIHYRIAAGLSPVQGNLNLPEDYQNFFLQESPRYIQIKKITDSSKKGISKVTLTLNAFIKPEDLRQYLQIHGVSERSALKYELNNLSSRYTDEFKYEITAAFVPGAEYLFRLEQGMLAADGAFTAKAIEKKFQQPDLDSEIAFALPGKILSRHDIAKLPVSITNSNIFSLRIEKIYANNVHYFLNNFNVSDDISTTAERIHEEEYKLTGDFVENKKINVDIDLSDLFEDNTHGLFVIRIGRYSYNDSRYFLATDIGLIARQFDKHLVIWASSLHTQDVLAGVEVKAVDRWNQIIDRSYTYSNGFARLRMNKDAVPMHVTATRGDDFSFIRIKKYEEYKGYPKDDEYHEGHAEQMDGVSSKENRMRTFIYSERQVYRPGETVHLVAVTRGREGILPERSAVVLNLYNPIGNSVVTRKSILYKAGIYIYDFKIPETARTGKWRATVKWKYKTIGHYDFQVEEFIPNKIQVKVEQLSIHRVHAGDVLEFKVKALSSFGPPAIGYQVNGNIRLYPHKFKPSGYAGFNFGHQDTRFPGIEHALPEARLDEQGHHLYRYPIQKGIDSPSGLMAVYSATILDSSGRGVTAYGETPVLLYRQFVGIRRLSEDIIYSEQPLGFETVNVNSDGKPIARDRQQLDFKVYLKKKIAHYRKNERGYYRYVIETKRVLMDELADPRDDLGNFFYTPHYDGLHVLEVTDQAGGQVSRYPFTVKGHTADVKTVVAGNKVQLNILGDDVSIDEKLKLEISSPFPGKVLLIGEREKILFTRVLDMEQHKTIVTLPIKPDYLPNFYISATAVKPVSQGSRRDPIYATGLLNVPVKDKSHTPAIHLRVSHKQARPQDRIRIFLKVDDTNRTDMHYTVAAVDTGILELTGYRLPDMAGYFNQKRRLEVQHYNMYKLVMPYEPEAKYSISPSGDMAPAESLIKKKQVNNPRVKPVALWSGLRKLNARGEGDVTFKLPDFDGKLRVMAVTFGDQRFASAQREITVRDKLVLKSGLPRFLANGDKFMIPVSLFNGIGKDGDIKLNIQVSDHIALHGHASKTVFMADKAEALEYFTAEAGQESGEAAVTLRAEGMGEFTQRTVKLPVRPASAIQHTGGSGTVSRETPKTIAFPIDFIPDTQQLAMRISSNRLAYFQNSLSYLLRYPHGSLEQTISKLFPLLYYSDMANSMGQISNTQKTLLDQLKQGIAKLERMQMENGAFAYWEGENNVNDWASIYAVHFMVEVQQQGHRIRTTAWDGMLGWLRQSVSEKPEAADAPGISHYIYALYVLGFAGGNTLAKLNNLYDMHMQGLKPHDKARLAAAFHTSGDDLTARRILRGITKFSEYDQPYRDTGGSFASNTRDLAIILDVMTQVIPDSPQIPRLVGKLAKQMREGRWASTQENAFAFLAVGKALRGNAMQIQAKISLGDGTRIPFENNVLLGTPELLKGSVRIEVSGDGELNYAWEAAGVMQTPESLQQDQGVHIRRRFLDRKGNPLDLRNVQQGNLAVAEIKIKSLSGKLENVAITDLLPMGLEIGNFRLINSPVLAWMKADLAPEYLDIRDDRINIFVSLSESEKTYYYLTRAVTAGEFKIPAIRAEAMYDPDIFSESGSGTLKIIPRQRSTAIPERATSIVSDAGNAAVLPAETALVTEDSSQETGPVIERPFKGNCTMLPKKVYLRRRGALQLPATGFVARKAHCVTTDEFPDHYPRSDSEAINTHLVDSCNLLKVRYPEFINGISPDCNEIYQCANKRHGACIWTSAGNGSTFGQGSAGNLRPEPVEEAWLGTMDWEPGTRPEPGTRFIIQNPANNKTAVIIMGYETGPAYGKWLAGISPEADWYLEANWSLGDALQGQTELRIGQAKHQNLQPGPINCQ